VPGADRVRVLPQAKGNPTHCVHRCTSDMNCVRAPLCSLTLSLAFYLTCRPHYSSEVPVSAQNHFNNPPARPPLPLPCTSLTLPIVLFGHTDTGEESPVHPGHLQELCGPLSEHAVLHREDAPEEG
jgi:hypothetical protein